MQPLREHDAWLLLLLLSCAAAMLHLLINLLTPYGIFRDELYYIACSKRPAFGYVDHPPLSIWLLSGMRWLLGDSLFTIRLLPALLSASTVYFAGAIALRLGGRRTAAAITGLTVLFAPIFLAMHSVYSMNVIDHLLWTLAAYVFVLILQAGDADRARRHSWLLLGLVMGLGCLNKIGMLWFGAGLAAALLLTPLRRELRTPWPWLSGGIALLGLLPFLLWNAAHDWAHVEFIRNASTYKYGGLTWLDFLAGQLLIQHPLFLPIWLGGLCWLFFFKGSPSFRPLGIIFVTVAAILLLNGHSKAEYLAAAFPMIYAAGGVWLERLTALRFRWLRPVSIAVVLLGGLFFLPMAAPVLPVPAFVSFSSWIGITHQNSEGNQMGPLPQFFADMHGWEAMARKVEEVYATLSAEEQATAVVFVRNYGQAGAVEYFCKRPLSDRVIAVHNNYWVWGYPDSVRTIIVIGGNEDDHHDDCDSLRAVSVIRHPYSMPYENDLTIWICRGMRTPLSEIWRHEKHFM